MGYGIAVDRSGNPYVTGFTESPDFPRTVRIGTLTSFSRAFVTKLRLLPELSIADASIVEGDLGSSQTSLQVTLSNPGDQTVFVNYAMSDISATSGADYTPQSGMVTIPAGATSADIPLMANGDTTLESNETFSVTLSSPQGATIARGSAVITIVDDDLPPGVSIQNAAPVQEGNSGPTVALFTVWLSARWRDPVTFSFTTNDGSAQAGSDYTTQTGALTFQPGETVQTIAVLVAGDVLFEPDETFSVTLTAASGASIIGATATATIIDDDHLPRLDSFSPVQAAVGQAVRITGAYLTGATVVLFGPCNASFTVDSGGQITAIVPAGGCSGKITIITPTGLGHTSIWFYVLPSLTIHDTVGAEGDTGTVNALFSVTLSEAAPQAITVLYFTQDGSARAGADYVAVVSGRLDLPAGASAGTISVPIIGDIAHESNETFSVSIESATHVVLSNNRAVGTIQDDDPIPALTIQDLTGGVTEGDSGTRNYLFEVSLSVAPKTTTRVSFETKDLTAVAGLDYVRTFGTLEFLTGETMKTIVVPIKGDIETEPTETFGVVLSFPVNATIATAQAVGQILDDDPLPSASVAAISVVEGTGAGYTPATFTIRLSSAPKRLATVVVWTRNISAVAGTDYYGGSTLLQFQPGERVKTVTVPVIADSIDENNERFELRLDNPVGMTLTTTSAIATIEDDDNPWWVRR